MSQPFLRRTSHFKSTTILSVLGLSVALAATPAHANGVALQAETPAPTPACAANPAAVVANGPAVSGLAVSGAPSCPAPTAPAAVVEDQGGIAIGNFRSLPTRTLGIGSSIAIGNGVTAGSGLSGQAVGIGFLTNATGFDSLAIGSRATANQAFSIALGGSASATGRDTIALGESSSASGGNSIALGSGATVSVANSIALGTGSVASRGALTNYTVVTIATPQTSIGEVSIGSAAGNRQLTGVAAGSGLNDAVNVEQLNNLAAQDFLLGTSVATAIGGGAAYNSTTGVLTAPAYMIGGAPVNNVGAALGQLDTQVSTNAANIATQTGRVDSLEFGVLVVGNALQASQTGLTTLTANVATNTSNIATNTANISNLAGGFLAVGADIATINSNITNLQTQVGTNTTGIAANNAAIGSLQGQVNGNMSAIAANATSIATAQSGLATTSASVATLQGTVTTLQSGVTANGSAIATLQTQQASTNSTVSGLQSQITNNTSQIQANTVAIANIVGGVAQGSVGLVQQAGPGADLLVGGNTDGANVNFVGTAGNRLLTGVAAGQVNGSSVDVINGSQLAGTAQSIAAALGGGASVNAAGQVTAPSYSVQGSAVTSVGAAISGLDTKVTANSNAITALQGQSAAGAANVAALQSQVTANTAGLATNTASITTLQGVVAGNSADIATTAINVSNLQGQVATNTGSIASNTAAIGTLQGQVATNTTGIATNAAGLAVVQGQTNANGSAIAVLQGQTTTNAVAISTLQGQTGTNAANIATVGNNLAAFNSQVSNGTIGLVQQASSAAPVTVAASTAGSSVNFSGTGGARVLSGVANGAVAPGSTEVVNGAQLAATNQAVSGVAALVVGQALGGFTSNDTSGAFIPRATGADSGAGGAGATASGNKSLAVGNSSQASGEQSAAVGNSAVASGTNSVALGAGSNDGGEANVVSVGAAASLRRITNVGLGTRTTDAVNLGQLSASLNQSLATANAYTDARIAQLGFDLRQVNRNANGGTAAAMALAAIPQSFQAGTGMIGGGIGVWQGQSAIAIGISKSDDEGRYVVKAGATYTSSGQGGASAGFGVAF